jgi:UDPglucose 6-dehydrogenase
MNPVCQLIAKNLREGRLSFSTNLCEAVASAEVVFIGVGTPSLADGGADLTFLRAAVVEIAESLSGFTVVATKSTVPVGTGDEIHRLIREAAPGADFEVVSNPEFLREGAAIRDFKLPDRIVIGTEDERAREVMAQLFRPLYINTAPILYTSRRTAELIKYAANAFLATKITFINEIGNLCEKVGANVQEVARGIGLDNRIGSKFLHAGPGFGGSCFPKDTLALARMGDAFEAPQYIVEAVVAVNERRKRSMASRVAMALNGEVRGKTVAILGLALKPNTDDMRESPSIPLIKGLQEMGAKVRVFDPAAMDAAKSQISKVVYTNNAYACAEGADALVLVTEWEQFRALDLVRLRKLMAAPMFVDLRNAYSAKEAIKHGFHYSGVGVGVSHQDAPRALAMQSLA